MGRPSIIFIIADDKTRALIPQLPRLSGGFADRLKGLLFALEWAEENQRPLRVYWERPLPIDEIFELTGKNISKISFEELSALIASQNSAIEIIDFLDKKTEEIQRLQSQINFSVPALKILVTNQFFAPTPDERKQRLRSAFQKNLNFKVRIAERAKQLCPLIDDASKAPLLGMQLRVGKHVGAQWTDPFLDSKLNWKLLRTVGRRVGKNCKSFVFMSDAGELQFGSIHPGLDQFRPRWGQTSHHFELSKGSASEQIVDTLAQFYILTCCEQIVHGKGEFGFLAAAVGHGSSTDYYLALSSGYRKMHKWNHRFSRWHISIHKALSN